jgi:hypothetical protein
MMSQQAIYSGNQTISENSSNLYAAKQAKQNNSLAEMRRHT